MKVTLITCLLIGVAGFCGALSRFGVATLIGRLVATSFPLGTFIINISGCLLLGWFLTYCGKHGVSPMIRLAIGTGFVGAYTTFSTFIYETNQLAGSNAYLEAAGNIVGSVVVGMLACWAGMVLAKLMLRLSMHSASEKILLRVYLQSADRAPHMPTFDQLIAAARRENLAGTTAIRGIMGAGYHGILKKPSAFSMIEHVPIIVEIVDSAEKIAAFVHGMMDGLMIGGMATLERAAVMMVRHGKETAASPGLADLADKMKPLSTVPKIEPGSHMNVNENGILLRVFLGESDRWQNQPLYEAIVQKVRELGLAGATVLRGCEGFGANSVVHKSRLLEMSSDLPIVIEIVDSEENIRKLQPHLETMVQEGMITMEYVMILMYRHSRADAPKYSSS